MGLTPAKLKLLKDATKEKRIDFTITINGMGKTLEDAWENALEGFTMDPGTAFEEDVTEVVLEEEY